MQRGWTRHASCMNSMQRSLQGAAQAHEMPYNPTITVQCI